MLAKPSSVPIPDPDPQVNFWDAANISGLKYDQPQNADVEIVADQKIQPPQIAH